MPRPRSTALQPEIGLQYRLRLIARNAPRQQPGRSSAHKPEAPAKPIVPPSAAPSRPVNFGSGRPGSDRSYPSLWGLVTRVRGRIAFGAPCPQRSLAREASTFSLVTCHVGSSRRGTDPVGETSNVLDTPLGTRHLVLTRPVSSNWRHPWSSQTKSRRSLPSQESQPTRRNLPGPASQESGHFLSPSPLRRQRCRSSTRTRPESTFIPTCIWSVSQRTATPTQSAGSAPAPSIFTRSSPG